MLRTLEKVELNNIERVIESVIDSRDKNQIVVIAVDSTIRQSVLEESKILVYRSFQNASSKAREILKENKLCCSLDNHKKITNGHAIIIRENGLTRAIVIDKTSFFTVKDLRPGILFLAKHITQSN